MKFYNVTNIFDLLTFDNKTTALSKKFEISTEMHFVSSFSLNERNITTSLVIIHLKCAVARYANLNSSSINMPYLRAVEYAIQFFLIFYLCLFQQSFVKNFMKILSFFNTNFQNPFQDVVCILQIIRMSNLVVLK